MKKILKGLIFIFTIIIITGCTKNYSSITYTKFNEVLNEQKGYMVSNQTNKYADKFERCLEAVGNNNQFLYYEFKTTEQAKKYIEDNYKGRKKYRFKDKKKYITVKCTKDMYFYAIQIDKSVIIGSSNIKKNKKEIKTIFKALGY